MNNSLSSYFFLPFRGKNWNNCNAYLKFSCLVIAIYFINLFCHGSFTFFFLQIFKLHGLKNLMLRKKKSCAFKQGAFTSFKDRVRDFWMISHLLTLEKNTHQPNTRKLAPPSSSLQRSQRIHTPSRTRARAQTLPLLMRAGAIYDMVWGDRLLLLCLFPVYRTWIVHENCSILFIYSFLSWSSW